MLYKMESQNKCQHCGKRGQNSSLKFTNKNKQKPLELKAVSQKLQ